MVASGFNTTGYITIINGVAQGTGPSDRIGTKSVYQSITLKGTVTTGATPTSSAFRWAIVWDNQPNGVFPTVSDIFTNVSCRGLNNLANRERFVILADKFGYVEAGGANQKPVKFYRKIKLETIFSGSTNSITSISSGAMYAVLLGELPAGVAAPVSNFTTRVRFTD